MHDDEVVGFEPLVRLPVQRGQALPEGRQALPPGQPPRPAARRRSSARPTRRAGSAPISWDAALDRVVAEIRRIQAAHGADAFAMLSGVSLTNEKSLPDRQVRPPRAAAPPTSTTTAGSAWCRPAPANKKALGIDRASNPWSDIPLADVVFVAGANVAECAPDHHQLHLAGARPRREARSSHDPRVTPLARTADVFLGLRPGTDSALMGAILHVLIARDWLDHDFIDAHTDGFDERPRRRCASTRRHGARASPACRRRASSRPPSCGARRRPGCCCTPAASSTTPRASRTCSSCINLGLATGKFGKPGCGVTTITGQGNGQGGREHGHKCDQLPGNRDITNPEHRAYVASVWGCDVDEIPGKGMTAQEIIERDPRRRDQGPAVDLLQPGRVAARHRPSPPRRSTSSSSTRSSTSSSPSPRSTPTSCCPGSLHEEDEGTSTSGRGPRHQDQRRGRPARRRAARLGDPPRHRARASARSSYFPYRSTAGDLRRAARRVARRHRRLLRHHLGADRGRARAVLAVSRRRAIRARRACTRAAGSTPRRPRAVPRRAATGRPPRWSTTSTRSGSPPAGSSASTSRARRRAASARSSSSTRSRCARCTRSSPSASASPTAISSRVTLAARLDDAAGARRRRPSGPTPSSSRTTGRAPRRRTSSPTARSTRSRRSPSTRSRAVRVERVGPGGRRRPTRATSALDGRHAMSRLAGIDDARSSSSTRAAASAARRACRRAASAAPTAATR